MTPGQPLFQRMQVGEVRYFQRARGLLDKKVNTNFYATKIVHMSLLESCDFLGPLMLLIRVNCQGFFSKNFRSSGRVKLLIILSMIRRQRTTVPKCN